MTPRGRRTSGLLLAALGASGLAPAPAPEWRELLARPLSPGSVALLVPHAAERDVGARWKEALKDGQAEVRAAAARAIAVSGVAGLVPEIAAALAAETDAHAAAEEAGALAALGGPSRDAELLAAARREPAFVPAVARALARYRERQAFGYSELVGGLGERAHVHALVRLAARGDPGALTYGATVALRERNATLWSVLLEAAHSASMDDGVLVAALQSSSPSFQAGALWYLVQAKAEPSARIVEAFDAGAEATASGGDLPERLAHEMLRRRLGRPAKPDPAWVAALGDPGPAGVPDALAQDPDALRRLTRAEREALSGYVRGDPRALDEWLREERSPLATPDPAGTAGLRIPDGFPPGLVADVFKVSGCTGQGRLEAFHGGQITYRVDGRPRQVGQISPALVPADCVEAVRALLYLALAPPAPLDDPGRTDFLVVPLAKDFVDCVTDARRAAPDRPPATVTGGRVLTLGGNRVQEPKKVHHLNPWYPPSAKRDGVSGTVVLEATITPSGCIDSVERLKGVDPRLDVASLVTVAQWRYTPSLLNGVPVPVIMTVTVNFRLN